MILPMQYATQFSSFKAYPGAYAGYPDHLGCTGARSKGFPLTRATLASIEPPGGPPPIDLPKAHGDREVALGDLGEEHPARALWVLLKQVPQQGLLHFAQLSARIKSWT
jgi:hypothetical protein